MAENDSGDEVSDVSNDIAPLTDSDLSNDQLDPDESTLSTVQTEQLLHFQDLTGIEDIGQCRQMMLNHNWDIESAVHAQFTDPIENARPRLPSSETRMPLINFHPLDQRLYTIVHRRPHGIMGWGYFIVSFPFQYFYSRIMSLFRFAYRLIWRTPAKVITNPLEDVRQFIRQFTETYGPVHPDFIEGTYCQALNMAKRDLKFLVIYLHYADRPQLSTFCRDTLCSEPVVEFIRASMLIWGCNADSPEGSQVLRSLADGSNSSLWLAVIVLRHSRLTVVAKMEDSVDRLEFIQRLQQIIDDNNHYLLTATMERDERTLTQTLRQQQDAAYQESLIADQEKEMTRRREKEKQEEELRLAREKEQQLHQELLDRKEEARNNLGSEPDADDPDAIKILLKLPNGIRLDRRFRKTDSIKMLHDYVFVHEAAPDNFCILHDFPRRHLPCRPSDYEPGAEMPTFESIGLGRSELLFVQDDDA